MDSGLPDAERSGGSRPGAPNEIEITADRSGFRVTNVSGADASVLVTLMAKATAANEATARVRLHTVTTTEGRQSSGPLLVAYEDGAEAYTRLWQEDIQLREHRRGGWVATRSGAVVVPVPAGSSFALEHDPIALRLGVVVAVVAGIGGGLSTDVPLTPIERGPAASIGEIPDPELLRADAVDR